jgi:threonine/homoserine/homoserine lactone efflux protein
MESLIGAAGLIAVAALTPGPNNFVVMRAAARSGVLAALPKIGGIVFGGLALLAVIMAGAGAAFAAEPRLRTVITFGGCIYLCYLGAELIFRSFGANALQQARSEALPSSAVGLFGFQFLNPKSWVMVVTATSATHGSAGAIVTFVYLAALFAIIPPICLVLWSALGSLMTKYLQRRPVRVGFDRSMGCLLAASAILLLIEA